MGPIPVDVRKYYNGDMNEETKRKISETLKRKGIKPPSNKGKKFTKDHVYKIIDSKRKNGSLYHTKERTEKIQNERKKYYDIFGRKSSIRDLIEATQKYKEWRKKVLSIGYCQKCKKKKALQTHHKKPLRYFIKKYNGNLEKIKNCDELFDEKLGIALCIKCHKEEDKLLINYI